VQLSYKTVVHQRTVRRYRERPARVERTRAVQVIAMVNEPAVEATVRRLGWRVTATNHRPDHFSLTQGVLAYRGEYLIERGFGRLKGRPLSLTPLYLQRDEQVTGLIRLLSIGLRVLTWLEFEVRRHLADEGEALAGLYAGNPTRATTRPTAERLLAAFEGLTLTLIEEPHQIRRHLTPLSPLQQRILALLNFPADLYTQLAADSSKPP